MNDLELYRKISEEILKQNYDKAEITLKDLMSKLNLSIDKTLSIIADVMLNEDIDHNIVKTSKVKRMKILSEFSNAISSDFLDQMEFEKSKTKNLLKNTMEDTYYKKMYLLHLGSDFYEGILSKDTIQSLISNIVDGKDWADRIGINKQILLEQLTSLIETFLLGKISVNEIKKIILQKFSYNAYEIGRLIDYEVARVQQAISDLFDSENGIEWQLYSATLDGKVCDKCSRNDGKEFRLDDSNKPDIPRHLFCRCCYIGLPSKGWRPKKRKVNSEKDIFIDWTDYETWKKEYLK